MSDEPGFRPERMSTTETPPAVSAREQIAREFWGESDNGRSVLLAVTFSDDDALAVWDALRCARAYVEERTHAPHCYKGRFIRSYLEEDNPQVKYASDLEREGIVP